MKSYRPYIKDPKGAIQKRTKEVAKKFGLRMDLAQTKIFETGLAVYEKKRQEDVIHG